MRNYAKRTFHLSCLLEKKIKESLNADGQRSCERIKHSLMQLPRSAIADQDITFHVVYDANDFAIGCVLIQFDTDGAESVIGYQSSQLQPAGVITNALKGTPFA